MSLSAIDLGRLLDPEIVRVERARRHLINFMEYDSRGSWQRARHLERLCDALEAVERGEITRLMVFMPPRHGKSEIVSKKFPAWYLGRNPDKEIILSSYAADLAYDFSRIARDTLAERGPELWQVQVASGSSAVGRWGVEGTRGGCVAAGVGGPITGRGANVGIVDDPFKNAEEAASATIRDKVWEWYRSTFRTRLAPGGAIVLVMTRWHEDDLAGRLIAEMQSGGEQWTVIEMQAEAEAGDPLGRAIGETLWPEHGFDRAWAEATKRAVGSYFWQALYQQRPSAPEGELLKRNWWKRYAVMPPPAWFDEIIQSWDMTFKDSLSSDYVVGQVWGRKGADRYLLDQVRARLDFPASLAAVRTMAARWPTARAILIEDKANGPAIIATLRREIPGLIPVEPQGSKAARVSAVSPQIEAGNVYLPDPTLAAWVGDFIEECAAFPNGAHDDQVDAMSQALIRMAAPVARAYGQRPVGW